MYATIAIDGACRGNGKPECISAGACYILEYDDNANIEQSKLMATSEYSSTSQRGELQGLLQAVEYVATSKVDTIIITDSEYLFNTMTKEWVERWRHNNWQTAQGYTVKNKDLWQRIWSLYILAQEHITFFHIKGHILSVGVKKSEELLRQDNTGYTLLQWLLQNKSISADTEKLMHATDLSDKNNGFTPDLITFSLFAAMNAVVDKAAGIEVDKAAVTQWETVLNS